MAISVNMGDLYYKKFPIKRRYFSLWQSKQLKHPNMRAISPSLGSCFISFLFMQKQFRYFWLSFNPFSNSPIVGIDDLKSFGKSLESWYSDIPIGSLYDSKAYLATTLSLSLQISKPMVGLSISVLKWWFFLNVMLVILSEKNKDSLAKSMNFNSIWLKNRLYFSQIEQFSFDLAIECLVVTFLFHPFNYPLELIINWAHFKK